MDHLTAYTLFSALFAAACLCIAWAAAQARRAVRTQLHVWRARTRLRNRRRLRCLCPEYAGRNAQRAAAHALWQEVRDE